MQDRDLGRRQETHRWTPEAGATTDVDGGRVGVLIESRQVRAHEPHESLQREDLPRVRVAAEHEIDRVVAGIVYVLGLVRQQHDREAARASSQCSLDVGLVVAFERVLAGGPVIDAGEHERRTVGISNRDVLVAQRLDAESAQTIQESRHVLGHVLVVACDEEARRTYRCQ